ncbi:translocation/assembly module TamB domain-containing protein [Henriciella sp.]|uniref:translocation/assembly module TamB domain-containing protein n=1 Tax=Henriciella sp. TaxID=1968823 RepID=UPI00260680FD|nr:translocation/assembly module TamB domain-containing protein [Henriciella sp.]
MSEQTAQPRTKRRPILKWSLIGLGVLLGLVLVLLLVLRFAAQSSIGRNFVETRIEAADPSGQEIEVEGLDGDLLGTFRIERLTVADDQGIWLVAENVLMDWKPLALRKRSIWVEAFEADLIHVQRQPNIVSAGEKPPQDESGGSMPLRAGKLDRLRIGELRTDEGLLPRALSLEINAQGLVGQDGGRTELSVLPLDGEGDRLGADLTWSEDLRVRGNLDLDGPAGGLFASLAQLEEGQSLSATLEAGGTLEEWAADANVLISEESVVQVNANTENDVLGFEIEAHPGLHPLSASIADTLGDTITINGRVLSDEDEQRLLEVTANADGLQLDAEASQQETGAYSADIRLVADNPARYANADNISVSQAILDGNLVYDQGAARFDGDVEASGVDVPSFRADAVAGPLVAVYDAPTASVRTTLTGRGAKLPGMTGDIAGSEPVVQLDAEYALDSGTLSLRQSLVRGQAGRVNAAGTVRLQPSLSANLSGSFQLDGAKAQLARPVNLDGQFEADRGANGDTRFSLNTTARNYGELPAPLSDWSDGTAIVSTDGRLRGDGAVKLNSFRAQSGSLLLTGQGQISSDQQVTLNADLSAGEASVGGYALSGLDGRARVSGALDDLNFDTTINAPSLSSDSMTFSDVSLSADGRYAEGALNAVANLDAGTSNGPLAVDTDVSLNGSQWQVNSFQGEWGDLIAEASLSGNGGEIGAIRGDLTVAGNLPDGLPAQGVEADASIDGETLILDATLETLTLGPTRADALVLRANGTPENINFVIDMDGRTELNELSYETGLDMDGNITGLSGGPLDLTASLSLLVGDLGLTTQEPIRYTTHDDGFDASARFATLGGTLEPAITTRGQTSIQVNGQGLAIAPALVLAGRPGLDGALDINVDLQESGTGLAGPVKAELKSIARPGSDLAPVDLFIDGDLRPDILDLTVRALDNEALEARLDTEVPVNTYTDLPFIQPQEGAEIPFSAEIDGQIEAVAALFVPPQMVLKGIVDVDMSGRLPQLNESFEGTFLYSEGEFEHGELGMVLHKINADARLGGGTVNLQSFNAVGRSGGTLSGNGTMAIDGSAQSNVEIEADSLVAVERREGSATISGAMQVRQQPELLEIIGNLTVDEGQINLANIQGGGGPPTLDVSFEEPIEEDEEEVEEEEAATRLDITLDAPGQIDLDGRGVNAELALDADITGSIGKPVIIGQASIVRGRFDFIGKRFEFAESSVRLVPDMEQSRLDVSATHETKDDILAILNVVGTLNSPEVVLTSEPALPEDEVLSRVLFGRSPTQLSGLEAARLAAALAQLSGGGGGFNLLGGIETALGLDTFDIGSDADGGTQVTSGKYLTENVYLEVRSGASGSAGVAIEWEPINNIEVEAATGDAEQGQQLSVQWKRDFDDGAFPGISGKKSNEKTGLRDAQPDADPGLPDVEADEEDDSFGTASDTAVPDDTAPLPDETD